MVVRRSRLSEERTRRPAGVEVVLAGAGGSAILLELSGALERDGWPTALVEDLTALPDRVSSRRRAVFVIHTRDAEAALQALERLDEKRHSALVVVLVEHASEGEYYCLTQAGAVQYFEVDEDLQLILRGIEWAAHVLAP